MQELPQERLALGISSMAAAQKAFDITCEYTRTRQVFGRPVIDFQNTRYKLADLKPNLRWDGPSSTSAWNGTIAQS